jgi:hypothetical protein
MCESLLFGVGVGRPGLFCRLKKSSSLELSQPRSMPTDLILDALDVEVDGCNFRRRMLAKDYRC